MRRPVVLAVLSVPFCFPAAVADDPSVWPRSEMRGGLLPAVEKELQRLEKQAEQEPGPRWPRPSREAAFLLLAGLAVHSEPIPQPSEEDRRHFDLDQPRGGRAQLFACGDEFRLVRMESRIQDKAGTYRVLVWKLYRLQGQKWVERGQGETTLAD
jgi:hypothetical protein